jgi:hypothetical protein
MVNRSSRDHAFHGLWGKLEGLWDCVLTLCFPECVFGGGPGWRVSNLQEKMDIKLSPFFSILRVLRISDSGSAQWKSFKVQLITDSLCPIIQVSNLSDPPFHWTTRASSSLSLAICLPPLALPPLSPFSLSLSPPFISEKRFALDCSVTSSPPSPLYFPSKSRALFPSFLLLLLFSFFIYPFTSQTHNIITFTFP